MFQGAKKAMCWAGLDGDSVLALRWMDEDHCPRIMTGESYGEMLRNEVWPDVPGRPGSAQGYLCGSHIRPQRRRAVMANFRKRCQVCLKFDGGHFE